MPYSRKSAPATKVTERAIWRGSISFGLVQIPVGLYRAESNHELHFTMLDKKSLTPVKYERKNGQTGKSIKWSDIVKGYEYQQGRYVVMTDEDFAAANVESSGNIDIIHFVNISEVDPLYYDKPYYLLPEEKSIKTYVLLRDALHKKDKVGIAKIIIRSRQHLALVRVYGQALVLELLRFPHELRPQNELNFPAKTNKSAAAPSAKELKMAASLIDSMTAPWEPEDYRDDYHEDLLALINKKKRAGGKVPSPAPASPTVKATAALDIFDLLRRSLGKGQPARARTSSAQAKPQKPRKKAKAARKPATRRTKMR